MDKQMPQENLLSEQEAMEILLSPEFQVEMLAEVDLIAAQIEDATRGGVQKNKKLSAL